MNVNSISFKGTFCLNQEDLTQKKFIKIIDKEDELCLSFEAGVSDKENKLFVHAPDVFDEYLMKLFNKVKIPFVRISEADSLNHQNIRNRIVINKSRDPKNSKLVEIDVLKLDKELQKDKEAYVGKNSDNGSSYRYDRAIKFLKTNQNIRSSIIFLRKDDNGEITTHVYDGRHRFAVMRDIGMTRIPVTIDEKSLELAKEIGLVKSEL